MSLSPAVPRRAPLIEELPAAARRHVDANVARLHYNPFLTATWQLCQGGRVLYLKAGWRGAYPTLSGERDRCLWLRERGLPVPEVVDFGAEDTVEWLLTLALPGADATAPEHLSQPERTVAVLAEGLRAFHEVDPADCPFDARVDAVLRHIEGRVRRGSIDPAGWHQEHRDRFADPHAAFAHLRQTVPAEIDLVVSHGDYCFPNVLIRCQRPVGFLDLGEAGVADRWRDLAIATWSTTWNVGPGHEQLFLDAYGVPLDLERQDFYRLCYDLES